MEARISQLSEDIKSLAPCSLSVGVDFESRSRIDADRPPTAFTKRELELAEAAPDRQAFLAGRWCAKEATVKALGAYAGIGLRDVEVLSELDGRPRVLVHDPKGRNLPSVSVSISHSIDHSLAVAIAY